MSKGIIVYTGCVEGTEASNHQLSAVAMPIAYTMVMFNSAVNPFANALINQRFREKMKGMICCRSSSSASRVRVAREPHDTEMANHIELPLPTAG